MSDELDKVIGGNIAKLRAARGYSQAELADRLAANGFKCTQQMVARIESGARPLRVSETKAFQSALQMDFESLVEQDSSETEAKAAMVSARRDVSRSLNELYDAAVAVDAAIQTAFLTAHRYVEYSETMEHFLLIGILEVPVLERVNEYLVESHVLGNQEEYLREQVEGMRYGAYINGLPGRADNAPEA